MKPLGILYLYRVRLRSRFVQEALAVIGIAVGVALLFASQVANTSLNGSVRQLTSGLVGQSQLQLEARGPGGFEQRLFGEVQALPGVRSAAPLLEAQANVLGPRGAQSVDLVGADPRFVHLGGALLRHFNASALARQHALALPLPVAQQIGANSLQVIKLQVGASSMPALVGITLQESDIGALVHSPVALAPLAYAQQLTGMTGRISRIFVQSRPGHDREVRAALVRLAAGRLNVEPADYDAVLFDSAATPTDQSTALFAAISALVGFLFAFNAMLLTVPARRALIADLRLDGYSPWTVIEVLLFDALVLGVVSSLLGLALGDELSARLFQTSPGFLSFAFAVGSQRIVTWQLIVVAVTAGLLAACGGVLMSSRDIFSSRPLAAVKRKERGRTELRAFVLGGAACLMLTTIIMVAVPNDATVGVVSLTVALLLLLPSFIRGVLAILERATLDLRAMAPSVAVAELRAPSSWTRTIAIASTGAIAVFGSVAIQGAHADLQRGLYQTTHDVGSSADVWVFPRGRSNLLATTPFPANATGVLTRLPGVRAVLLYRGGFLNFGDRRVWVSAQPRAQAQLVPRHQLVSGDLAYADARLHEGGWAVVSLAVAKEHHLHIGQLFTLPAPRPTTFRVAALSTNMGWPSGALILNADDYAHAWESNDASAYEIMLARGVPASTVSREVRKTLGPGSPLVVQTASQREQADRAIQRQGLDRLNQISTLVLIAAVLAMASAMGNMIWQRRAWLARMKLDGRSDFQVWRTLLLESILLLGSGCTIGAVFGLYGQLLGSRAILSVTGFPVVFSFGVVIAMASFALVSTVAVLIVAIPGYLAARVRPSVGL
jgi:putative ABC transport system permease protein